MTEVWISGYQVISILRRVPYVSNSKLRTVRH